MHPAALIQLLVLLSIANGAPVIAKKLLGGTLAQPLDGRIRFLDRRPLFGASKTLRGVIVAVVLTAAAAALLGLDAAIGALVGATAMAGDLFSSFVKRRLGLPPSSRATGLDQIPEALFPAIACRVSSSLPLSLADIAIVVAAFFGGGIVLSRLFYRLGLRDQPH